MKTITLIPGNGIGPEVIDAENALTSTATKIIKRNRIHLNIETMRKKQQK